jgi:hypothetical protein
MVARYTKLANRFQQKELQKQHFNLLRNTFHYIPDDLNFDSYARTLKVIRSLQPDKKTQTRFSTYTKGKNISKI